MTAAAQTTRFSKRNLLIGLVAFAALATLAWSQVWFTITEIDARPLHPGLDARGSEVAPAVLALGLVSLAAVAGLALAGRVFRLILGVLVVVIGVTMMATTIVTMASPLPALTPTITELTGVAGAAARDLVRPEAITMTPMPWLAVLAGAGLAATGVLVTWFGRAWPASGRRFEARFDDADGGRRAPADTARGAVDAWDALSSGDDPTDERSQSRSTD